jgi:hypothetical protein
MRNRRIIFSVLIFLFFSSSVALASAYGWIFLGQDQVGETHPSGDIAAMYFYNDGVYAFFNETLVGAPNASAFSYYIYLDKPVGGRYLADFRLIYSSSTSKLQKRTVTGWVDVETITVTTSTSPNSVVFKVRLSSIANPDIQQDTYVLYLNIKKWPSKQSDDLVYGKKNVDVGDVSFWADSNNLYVNIQVDPGWAIHETHVKVSKDRISWSAPGHWPYSHEFNQPVTSDDYTIPLSNIGYGDLGTELPFRAAPDEPIFIMVTAAIEGDGRDDETAYACEFKEWTLCGDWASAYICHEVVPELPWPTPVVFVPAVAVAVYVIYRRRFNYGKREGWGLLAC